MNSAALSDLVTAVHCEKGLLSIKLISHGLLLVFNLCYFTCISYMLLPSSAYGTFQKGKICFPEVYRWNVEEAKYHGKILGKNPKLYL